MTFLPYILDILALVLVVGTAVQAYRKGFVRAALNFAGGNQVFDAYSQ